MLRLARARVWESSEAAMARAVLTWSVMFSRGVGWWTMLRVRRLFSRAQTRFCRQAASARAWTNWFFSGSFGVVFSYEMLDVLLVGFKVVGRQDDGLAGESVAKRVQ